MGIQSSSTDRQIRAPVALKKAAKAMRNLRQEALKSGYRARGFSVPISLVQQIDEIKLREEFPNRDVVVNRIIRRTLEALSPDAIPLPRQVDPEPRRRIILSLHEDLITFVESVCSELRNAERGVALEAIFLAHENQGLGQKQLTLDSIWKGNAVAR